MLFGPVVDLHDPIESVDVKAGVSLMSTRKIRRIAEGISYHPLCLQEIEPVLARYHL